MHATRITTEGDSVLFCKRTPDGIGEMNCSKISNSSVCSTDSEDSRIHDGFVRPQTTVRWVAAKRTDLEAYGRVDASQRRVRANFRKPLSGSRPLATKFNREIDAAKNMQGNSKNVCRYCNRQFTSGRALGGHMRAHGSLSVDPEAAGLTMESDEVIDKEQLSGSISNDLHFFSHPNSEYAANRMRDHSPKWYSHWARFKELQWSRSGFVKRSKAFEAKSSEDVWREEDDAWSVLGSSSSEANNEERLFPDDEFDDEKAPSSHDEMHPLYALRSNPKRSRRFTDRDFALEVAGGLPVPASAANKKTSSVSSEERARACSVCGKEFPSWKALFGHMRCHPEREWRGIQPPDSTVQQEGGVSSLEGVERMKSLSPYPTFTQDSGLEADPDSENEHGGEEEESYKKEEEKLVSIKKLAGEAANSSQEEGKACNQIVTACEALQNKAAEDETASCRKGAKNSDRETDTDSIHGGYMDGRLRGWVTRKRSKRSRHTVRPLHDVATQEPELESVTTATEIKDERDMADCLVMLACAGDLARSGRQLTEESTLSDHVEEEAEDQRSEANSEDFDAEDMDSRSKAAMDAGRGEMEMEVAETSLCEDGDGRNFPVSRNPPQKRGAGGTGTKYKCSTCKRSFNSHQALGGHRASHRKVKGCFARTNDNEEFHENPDEDVTEEEFLTSEEQLPHQQQQQLRAPLSLLREEYRMSNPPTQDESQERRKIFKTHECSICHRVFASGQALGGHKRCHWTGEKTVEATSVASSSNNKQPSTQDSLGVHPRNAKREEFLDLNLPAPLDEEDMVVAYDMAEVVPAYGRLLDSKRRQSTLQSAVPERDNFAVSDTEDFITNNRFISGRDSNSAHRESRERRFEEDEGFKRSQPEFARRSELNFSGFVHCNICDSFFTSLEALSSHQKTHSSFMSSVAGFAPISV